VALRPIPWYQRVPPDAPSRTPSCAQNKNSISVLDIPSNTCGPLLVSDSKRVHILFTSVLNYISSNKTPCPDRNSVLDLIPWLVTPVFPRIGGRVVPIKHRMYYVHRQHVLQNKENQCTVVNTGWVYRDIRFWVPPPYPYAVGMGNTHRYDPVCVLPCIIEQPSTKVKGRGGF